MYELSVLEKGQLDVEKVKIIIGAYKNLCVIITINYFYDNNFFF